MDFLLPLIDMPVFSTVLTQDDTGFVNFGMTDDSAYTGKLTQLAVDNSTGEWVIDDVSFGASGQAFNASSLNMILGKRYPLLPTRCKS